MSTVLPSDVGYAGVTPRGHDDGVDGDPSPAPSLVYQSRSSEPTVSAAPAPEPVPPPESVAAPTWSEALAAHHADFGLAAPTGGIELVSAEFIDDPVASATLHGVEQQPTNQSEDPDRITRLARRRRERAR